MARGVVARTDVISNNISNCQNTGDIIGNYAGGILGVIEPSNSLFVTISNSYNTGAVTGTSNAGGILGYAYTDSTTGQLYATISNSYNTGAVTGTNNAGGILGCAHSYQYLRQASAVVIILVQ